jgi:uncharacterized protein (DUF1501 family)
MNDERSKACAEFTRAKLLRDAAATAGNGLPAIEAGMPAPAGTGLSRRTFLLRTGGLMLTIYGASKLGAFGLGEGIAQAAAGPQDPILVSVYLEGGADSLSLLAPVEDSIYRKLRPTLALSPDAGVVFADDNRLRWNPAADALRTLHDEGKLAVAPSIGYDHPDQSHFTSRHYWEVGDLDPRLSTGWLGRYLDAVGAPDNPLQGLSLDWSLNPALAPASAPVAAISRPDDYQFYQHGVWGDDLSDAMIDSLGKLGSRNTSSDPQVKKAAFATAQSMRLREQLLPFAVSEEDRPPVLLPHATYPTGDDDFPQRMQSLAAMIDVGLPLRCVSVQATGGYDTHDDQAQNFATNIKMTTDTLLAFQRDLEARGLQDRVLVEVWTEFGRRPEENGSGGTDHGAAGAAFLIGSRVKRQLLGEFTGLTKLDDDDNMRASFDYRALHGAILDQWFGFDAARVMPNVRRFQLPELLT